MANTIQHGIMESLAGDDATCRLVQEEQSDEVCINIKRTFIELVATPRYNRRLRSLTDTELLLVASNLCSAEVSEASTGTPSDAEETGTPSDAEELDTVEISKLAEWASPAWGPSGDEFYSDSMLEPFVLPMAPSDVANVRAAWATELDTFSWPTQRAYHMLGQHSGDGNYQSEVVECAGPYAQNGGSVDTSKTTIMVRNLPPAFTRLDLIELLEDEGFEGSYDLVYVPMNFSSRCCLGYGFVNFQSASEATRAWEAFDGFCSWDSTVPCEVVWSDPHQGIVALVERYRNSPVMHESVPDQWRPAYFVDGVQMPFPVPTASIKAPKQKSSRSKPTSERH